MNTIENLPLQIKNIIEEEQLKINNLEINNLKILLEKQRSLRNGINPKTLIAIHLTNYFPENGIIRTKGQELKLNQKLNFPRETIHFTLNGPVSNQGPYGNWDDYKYAILIPLDKIFERVLNITPNDSYVLGELEIPNGSLIIAKKLQINNDYLNNIYINSLKKKAKDIDLEIIENNLKIKEVVFKKIESLGYNPIIQGQWGWQEAANEETELILNELKLYNSHNFNEIFNQFANESNKKIGAHSNNILSEIEFLAEKINLYLDRERLFKIKDQIDSYEIDKLKQQILSYYNLLKKELKNVNSKQEKEAYLRIVNILKTSYMLIDKTFTKEYISQFNKQKYKDYK